MSSVNKVILVGNLGRDPDVRYTPDGAAVCNISIATSETWKDKQTGERREATEWHRVVMYNRLGEVAGEYLKKGSKVYIEGKLKTRKWQDKDTGADRYSTEVVADTMKMLDSRSDGDDRGGYGGGGYDDQPQQRRQAPQRQQGGGQRQQGQQQRNNYADATGRQQPQQQQRQAADLADMDDDIPF